MQAFEKLGVFYLGRERSSGGGEAAGVPLLYDSRDLLTHAVTIGMTGSGKTGLCVALLEEAALDGVPALVIDPKGDLGNLLLTFPDLAPESFLPWVTAEEAQRKGVTREALAAEIAKRWRDGLAAWDQDGDRIRRLREAAECAIFTPGSDAGRPVSILASFAAPPSAALADADLLRDRVETAATSLLGLLGIDADPLRSREHILLSTLLDQAWRAGRDYDLAALIRDVQKPPVAQIGVMDLETFFPSGERFRLAMAINNLIAAPGFGSWLTGEPLDPDRLLYTATGKPRLAIFSIAHLSESERMFFVSLLLNQTLGWMRSRPGSTSLRAILYMDEIFGYLPPTANPPSKRPFLTLLKQARAYGLGLTLATQNPVDLDYKALANIGTWWIGRLQTEQDRARVLDGLFGAGAPGAGSQKARVEELMGKLGSRVFLMHNVHDDGPTLFESRWAMSYLAGPLSREQIKRLQPALTPAPPPAPATTPVVTASSAAAGASEAGGERPVLPPGVEEVFIAGSGSGSAPVIYVPMVFGQARVFYQAERSQPPVAQQVALVADFPVAQAAPDWASGHELTEGSLAMSAPVAAARFVALPGRSVAAPSTAKWSKALQDHLFRGRQIPVYSHRASGVRSRPGEAKEEFHKRLSLELRELRDRAIDKVRAKYAPKIRQIEGRLAKAQANLDRQQTQASTQKLQTAAAIGATLLGGLFGRRKLSATTLGRASSAVRSFGRSKSEAADVDVAREAVAALASQRQELDRLAQEEASLAAAGLDPASLEIETGYLGARKADIEVVRVAVAWVPRP